MNKILDERSGWHTLETVTALFAEALTDRFLAGYAMGSLARGGFSPLVSDVDFGLLIRGPLIPEDNLRVEAVRQQAVDSNLPLSERLSIFWGSPNSLAGIETGGRFPPFDKLDLLEHARLIDGVDARQGIPRPTARELEVDGIKFALEYLDTPARMREFENPALLLDRDRLYLTKTVLYPARFLYTLDTGHVAGNEASVEHFVRKNTGPDSALVKAAYGWRQGDAIAHTTAVELVNTGLIMLYQKFLKAYLEQMLAYDEKTLADSLRRWLRQLA